MKHDLQSAGALPIVIVGGGYSGAITAVQLLRAPNGPRVLLVERSVPFARGLAYCHHDDNLLLNVPAGNMTALAGEPDHFVAYCQAIDPAFNAGSFVSRRLYGDYLEHTLAEAERNAPGRFERVVGEASAVRPAGGRSGFDVQLADGRRFGAAQVVLALGHMALRDPLPAPGLAALGELATGPWNLTALDALPRDRPVLLIGSGHTAIDVLFRLTNGCNRRPVVMVSRHGLLPNAHRSLPKAPAAGGFPSFLAGSTSTVRGLLRALREEARRRSEAGGDWRDVINEMRAHTPAIWQGLALAERQRFLNRVMPYWDVHRHRLAPTAHHRLSGLLTSGQAQVIAGRISACAVEGGAVRVTLRQRHDGTTQQFTAAAVVNCSGPTNDLARIESPLVRQLLAHGLVRPDALKLGLEVDPAMRVVDAGGQPVAGLHTIGPMLKATYWEAIAVPELRGHAQRLAAAMLQASAEVPVPAPAQAPARSGLQPA